MRQAVRILLPTRRAEQLLFSHARTPQELLSWTFDKIVKDCAPEGCAKYIIPPGLPGSAVAAARPGSRATGAASSLPVRQRLLS